MSGDRMDWREIRDRFLLHFPEATPSRLSGPVGEALEWLRDWKGTPLPYREIWGACNVLRMLPDPAELDYRFEALVKELEEPISGVDLPPESAQIIFERALALSRVIRRQERAVAILEKHGLRYDPDTRRVAWRGAGSPNAFRPLYVALWRSKWGENAENSREAREWIAGALEGVLHPSLLDTTRKGDIFRALRDDARQTRPRGR